jgi:aminopeptidase
VSSSSTRLSSGPETSSGSRAPTAPRRFCPPCSGARWPRAHPYTEVELTGISEWFVANASDDQLSFAPPFRRQEVEDINASVTVWGEVNTHAFTQVDAARQARWLEGRRVLGRRRRERWERGETRWCGLAYPTHGLAQDAQLTLADYEDFVFAACGVQDGGDPTRHWQSLSAENPRPRLVASARRAPALRGR